MRTSGGTLGVSVSVLVLWLPLPKMPYVLIFNHQSPINQSGSEPFEASG